MAGTTARAGPGIALYAHLSEPIGIGSSGRGLAAAIAASGLPTATIDVPWPGGWQAGTPLPTPAELDMPIAVFATNPDTHRRCIGSGTLPGPSAGGKVYRIGHWSWESPNGLPDEWRTMAVLFDEIWAPSSYGAACIAPFVPLPVVVMPAALVAPPPAGRIDLARFGMRPGTFTFLSIFDGRSNLDRKNPGGVIRAFRAAFAQPRPDVRLVLKSRGLLPRDRAVLDRMIAGRPDIRILDRTMTAAEMAALVAGCGCYVSLHRAEAMGLTMVEAMALGRPVIATAHSGNLDFMSPETAALVAYRFMALPQESLPFRQGTIWAEPSIAHAAELMRQTVSRPEQAAERAKLAAGSIRRLLSADAVGGRIAARIDTIRAAGRLPAPAAPRRAAGPRDGRTPGLGGSLLVATPVKNAAPYLGRYFDLLERLAVDPARLSIGMLESDSSDGTWEALEARREDLAGRYARVTLARHDFGYRLPQGPRYQAAAQHSRRATLARSRNRLLAAALRDEDWVLWLDVDVCDYPPDLVERLAADGRDIAVPHCVLPNGRTFDRNTFVLDRGEDGGPREDPRNLMDGVYLPEQAVGRRHLEDFPADHGPVEVHGVGGTALLVRADLHREGPIFPVAPHRGYLETEGLAVLARDMGYSCWGLPAIRIVHPPL